MLISTFELPSPPTTNALFYNRIKTFISRGKRAKGRGRTAKYNQWITDAGWMVKLAKQPIISGSYACNITLALKDRADTDGRIKAILDLMQNMGQTPDDRYCVRLVVERSDRVSVGFVRVELMSTE